LNFYDKFFELFPQYSDSLENVSRGVTSMNGMRLPTTEGDNSTMPNYIPYDIINIHADEVKTSKTPVAYFRDEIENAFNKEVEQSKIYWAKSKLNIYTYNYELNTWGDGIIYSKIKALLATVGISTLAEIETYILSNFNLDEVVKINNRSELCDTSTIKEKVTCCKE